MVREGLQRTLALCSNQRRGAALGVSKGSPWGQFPD